MKIIYDVMQTYQNQYDVTTTNCLENYRSNPYTNERKSIMVLQSGNIIDLTSKRNEEFSPSIAGLTAQVFKPVRVNNPEVRPLLSYRHTNYLYETGGLAPLPSRRRFSVPKE